MIIPQPFKTEVKKGKFEYTSPDIYVSGLSERESDILLQIIRERAFPNAKFTGEENGKGIIRLINNSDKNIPEEGYELEVTEDNITIKSNGYKGLLYGMASVTQMYDISGSYVPAVKITDKPRLKYRGLMLDVSRNFFSTDYIKNLLRIMAYYKINTFHWHLTDGSGWRVEIKKYPKLTECGAFRPYKDYQDWDKNGRKFCSKSDKNANGGYYTQEEIKEIVAYAKALNITVIPEISMPANSEEVLAAYPELGCKVAGNKNSFCIGNEESFVFLENVLSEILMLFPSEYISIGGSSTEGMSWEKCPRCKDFEAKEKFKNTAELNKHFMNHMELFLKNNGRKAIAWSNVLHKGGEVSSSITIMSLGEGEYNLRPVKKGYNTILSPANFAVLSTYQGTPATEPEASGGYISMENIYKSDPFPSYLYTEEQNRILGIEGLLWTEYISTEDYANYMIFPRLLAISEVAWTFPENKSWNRFIHAINHHHQILEKQGVKACPVSSKVTKEEHVNLDKNVIELTLKCDRIPSQIRYTLDGSKPDSTSALYEAPIEVKDSLTLKVATFDGNKKLSSTQTFKSYYHKAIGKKVTYNCEYSPMYHAGNETALTDGYTGSFTYNDGNWQAFAGNLDVTVDLGESTKIKSISARFMQQANLWIWLPERVEIYASDNGKDFTLLKHTDINDKLKHRKMAFRNYGYSGDITARYVRYVALREPDDRTYMFVDEIVIL